MPGRRFFPFLTKLPPDIFGLERLSLLSEACLTEDERQARSATIRDHLEKAFKDASRQLGEEAARSLFGEITRKPKRGVMKSLAPDRDYQLLRAHDTREDGETVKALAERLYAGGKGKALGQSADAIRRQIFAVVEQRRKRERANAVQARYQRMAARNDPPTLAQSILSGK